MWLKVLYIIYYKYKVDMGKPNLHYKLNYEKYYFFEVFKFYSRIFWDLLKVIHCSTQCLVPFYEEHWCSFFEFKKTPLYYELVYKSY